MTGTARQFSSAAEQAAALVKAWASCGDHPICPESDPYLLISSGADASALCGHWCPGDGGHCATTDAAYRFTYAVANGGHDIGAFVLELDSQASNGRYSITWWDALPYPVMKLASLATGETTTLQGVGVPVQ